MPRLQSYCKPLKQPQIENNITNRTMILRLQGYNFNLKYGKSGENICDCFSRHPYKDLLKFKELMDYVTFVADDATPKHWPQTLLRNSPKIIHFYIKLVELARKKSCNNLKHVENWFWTVSRSWFSVKIKSNSHSKGSSQSCYSKGSSKSCYSNSPLSIFENC